jgi:hypothetical protein
MFSFTRKQLLTIHHAQCFLDSFEDDSDNHALFAKLIMNDELAIIACTLTFEYDEMLGSLAGLKAHGGETWLREASASYRRVLHHLRRYNIITLGA